MSATPGGIGDHNCNVSFCNSCTPTADVAQCMTSFVIGTIANISTAVYVYVENKSSGKIDRFSVTSSGAGLVTLTRGSYVFMDDTPYEIWITLATADNVGQRLAFTISGASSSTFCADVRFRYVTDTAGAAVTYTTQTLKA